MNLQFPEVVLELIPDVDLNQLLAWAQEANDTYRRGEPVIPDPIYDQIIERIKVLDPNNPFVNSVEEEPEDFLGKTVTLPARMLSTDKAYSMDRIQAWIDRVVKEAAEIGVPEHEIVIKATPKFDGFAAYDDGRTLYTRGNGYQGSDISHILGRGVLVWQNNFGQGPGELVVETNYFDRHLSDKYENTRNVLASVVKEGELDQEIKDAIADNAVWFMPFSACDSWVICIDELLENFHAIRDDLLGRQIFDTDGLVIEVVNEDVKAHMGSTGHHHRWQIAYKENTEFHTVKVRDIQWQTAKTGRITPVVLLEPTRISGVMVSKATGHHCGNIVKNGIDSGTLVEVCRSGLVIPYITRVIKPVDVVSYPATCPSCGSPTNLDGDNLFCTNTIDCPAQIERTIYHFFDTIGNCDGFGPQTISMLCSDVGDLPSVRKVTEFYKMTVAQYMDYGFGEKTAHNLVNELSASLRRPIEDWRFLAAFGIDNVGKGGCERLLKHHSLFRVFDLTVDDLIKIDGFGEKTAQSLVRSLARIKPEFDALAGKFNLLQTPRGDVVVSPISGMTIVFTGTMQQGSRDDMETQAKRLGAKVSGSVSSRTHYLVCGANVGKAKTDAAAKHGVQVLTEEAYLNLIGEIA